MSLPRPGDAKTISDPAFRQGVGFALAAYSFWGVAPVYFVWVRFAEPMEVLAYRVVWSLPLLALLVTLGGQWRRVRGLSGRELARLGLCAALLSGNWLTFIYGIQTGRIAETSLGYFINPLVSIVLGGLFLGERMRRMQWCAAALALAGAVYELVTLGSLPWIALVLAFSFGFYGLLRKQVNVPSAVGLGVETSLAAPAILIWLSVSGGMGVALDRTGAELALLMLGGVITVAPLIWFGAAATRLPLSILGFFQYLAPSLSLLLAVFIYHEQVPAERWVNFGLVWLAILLFVCEGLYYRRRNTFIARGTV